MLEARWLPNTPDHLIVFIFTMSMSTHCGAGRCGGDVALEVKA